MSVRNAFFASKDLGRAAQILVDATEAEARCSGTTKTNAFGTVLTEVVGGARISGDYFDRDLMKCHGEQPHADHRIAEIAVRLKPFSGALDIASGFLFPWKLSTSSDPLKAVSAAIAYLNKRDEWLGRKPAFRSTTPGPDA